MIKLELDEMEVDNEIKEEIKELRKIIEGFPSIVEIDKRLNNDKKVVKIYSETRGYLIALKDVLERRIEIETNEDLKRTYQDQFGFCIRILDKTERFTRSLKNDFENHYKKRLNETLNELREKVLNDLTEVNRKPVIYHIINDNMYNNGLRLYTLSQSNRISYIIGKRVEVVLKKFTLDGDSDSMKTIPEELRFELSCVIGAKIGKNGSISEWMICRDDLVPMDFTHSHGGIICMGNMLNVNTYNSINNEALIGNYDRMSVYIDEIAKMFETMNDNSSYKGNNLNQPDRDKLDLIYSYVADCKNEMGGD